MFFSSISKTVVPVITFNGTIANNSNLSFKKQNEIIESAFKVYNVKTIAVIINSPGGSPVQSELIFKRVRSLAKEKNVEILVFIEDCAASGGYYLSLVGDKIYASNSSIIGSIGVVSSGFGFHELIKKYGIERRIYTQGENKSILDPFLPRREKDIEIINSISSDIHDEFINIVKERRGDALDITTDGLFSGKVWSGKKAKEIGLIDDIGDLYSVLHEKYGDKYEIKHINEPVSFASSIRSLFGLETMCDRIVQEIISYASQNLFG